MSKIKRCTLLFYGLYICYIFNSCATLSNSKSTLVTVNTTSPSYLVVNSDTLNYCSNNKIINVMRSKDSLRLTAFNNDLSRTVAIKSQNSAFFWLNLFPYFNLWTGFYIDTKTKKRYTYSQQYLYRL